ncbi:conserved hypothetical protein [Candidatus Zixiibacteriota bacterium]|nr:conserved hypothetical protein [candidate division Zixibacteria bacterium]
MNILALNWQDLTNPQAGGAEVHLEELLRRLVKKGHRVTLFCSSFPGAAPEEVIQGVRIIRRGSRFNFNLVAPWHLRRLVRSERFDLMIEDINKIPFYTPLYMDIPTLVVVPHLFSTTVFKEINFLLGFYIYFSERPLVKVYKKCKFNVISESTADDIARRGIPRENISIVHCGIDAAIYNHDASIRKYESPTILYLGRVKKYKSVDHLIAAFKLVLDKVPEAQLKIVGSGDYLPKLKALAEDLKIADRVHFPGFVSLEDKVEIIRRSHVAVYPSLKEGWGLTNIEANACGTTVIAANVPGLKDSVVDNETGLLYPYGDINQLANKILAVITDEGTRCRLEKGGREWAGRFNWDRAGEEFMAAMEKVIG